MIGTDGEYKQAYIEVCGESHTPAALQPGMSLVLDGQIEEKNNSRHAYAGTAGRRRKSSNPFATSALEGKGRELSVPRSDRFTLGKESINNFGPRGLSGQHRKSRPHRDLILGPSSQ